MESKPEKKRLYAKQYHETHKEEIQLRKKLYRENNKELISEQQKNYYILNREKINEKKKENRDKINEKRREIIKCECGKDVRNSNYQRHLKTFMHERYILKNKFVNHYEKLLEDYISECEKKRFLFNNIEIEKD